MAEYLDPGDEDGESFQTVSTMGDKRLVTGRLYPDQIKSVKKQLFS
ncbi:MAG: hypothetical protein K9J38_13775 [Polynucleobacter sp.]|nr:hypothetical protein [Polynucleobacter sp.]